MIQAFILACLFHAIPMTIATVICYLTSTREVGCCFLPVILILGASFVSALLLVSSTEISAFRMRYDHKNRTSKLFGYYLAAILSAAARTLRKTIAYLNAIALLLHCTLSLAGAYNNCYCNSSRIGLGDSAYVVFLTAAQIRTQIISIWGGCLAIVLVELVVSTFYLVTLGRQLIVPLKSLPWTLAFEENA